MGGRHGFGQVEKPADAPPFAETWEGKAFVIGALAARIAGTNLHAFRHAIERVPPDEYLVGYWNRWTIGVIAASVPRSGRPSSTRGLLLHRPCK